MNVEKQNRSSENNFLSYFWLIPAVVIIVAAFFSYANVDTTRDYLEAYRIATGQNLPLLGQQMAFSFSVGPWWFYLLSVVLLVNKSWLMLAVFTAVLNAIKFYLAFQIGRLLADKVLGLLMVLGLLLISFTLMQSITFTHTSLVESMMLLIVWVTLKDSANKSITWFTYGLLCALAFHVHPTAVLAGYFIAVKWFHSVDKIKHAGYFLIGSLLILMPLIINEFWAQETMVQGAVNYIEKNTHRPSLEDYFKLISGLWLVAPYVMLKALVSQNMAVFLVAVQVSIQLLALFAPVVYWHVISQKLQKYLRHLWAFLLLSCLGLILIREITPWYMTYGVTLIHSMLTAVGLYVIYKHSLLRQFIWLIGGWVLLVFISAQYLIIENLERNEIMVPSLSLNDIKSHHTDLSGFSYEILAHKATSHGQFTCQNSPVSLHGPYSSLIYSHSGMEHMSQCSNDLFYGPKSDAQHWLGIPPQFKNHINSDPVNQIGNTYFYRPIDISAQQVTWTESFKHDYERKIKAKNNSKEQLIRTELMGGRHLTVTRLVGFKMTLKIIKVTVNGGEIEPVSQYIYSSLYVCEKCSTESTLWQVEYQESVSGMTNVVSF